MKKANLAVVTTGAPPTVDWSAIIRLARKADQLIAFDLELERIDERLSIAEKPYPKWLVERARELASRADIEAITAECTALGEPFDRPDWHREPFWTRTVTEQVAVLVGSFPSTNAHNPEIYTRTLIEDLIGAEPHVIILASTCRRIRQSAKFLPSVAEVLAVLESENVVWCDRWPVIDGAVLEKQREFREYWLEKIGGSQ